MRADRLLRLLLILQTEGRVKAKDLARRLEVSPRTIYRDLDALTAAGVPVYATPGPAGGIALLEGYRTDLTGLGGAEVRALFLGRSRALLGDLGLGGAAEGALAKLLAALPARARPDAAYARQRVHVDAAGWRRSPEPLPFLPVLQGAVWEGRRVRLGYVRGDGAEVERLVDPLGLVARGPVWYLVAAVSGEARSYRVSRVRSAEVGEEPCVRPDGFDLESYWEASKASFREALPRYPATVRAPADLVERMRTSARYARVGRVDPGATDAQGRTVVDIVFEVEWEACEFLLGLGPRVEVLAPAALRERVLREAEETVALYRLGAAPAPR